ncbi:hypothetical protein [Pseudomonas sp. Marseille-Q5115]|uniref:hypothetical protein n=1 Tax=Pseudomonas sp. Marseille-Q5115 TaxID=2866593 RepID=UPI001CE3D30C|nr:hypothetical protein [Pseudomonas sp. Marseille-Q5115]
MKPTSYYLEPSPNKIRLFAAILIPILLPAGVLACYWTWHGVLPIYGRLYRNAPVVETPYLLFWLLMAPPGLLALIIGLVISAVTGKSFDPPKSSRLFKFQSLMFAASFKILVYTIPFAIVVTTALLIAKGYSPCSKLLVSGSAWQVFWVNDERACFKPDHYINDNWSCKKINGEEVCIEIQGW